MHVCYLDHLKLKNTIKAVSIQDPKWEHFKFFLRAVFSHCCCWSDLSLFEIRDMSFGLFPGWVLCLEVKRKEERTGTFLICNWVQKKTEREEQVMSIKIVFWVKCSYKNCPFFSFDNAQPSGRGNLYSLD